MMNKSIKNVSCLLLPLVISYILIMVFLPASYIHQFFYINPLFRITDFIIGIFLFLLYDKKIKHIKLNNQLSTIFEILSVVVIAVFVIVLKVYPDIVLYSIFYWIPIGLVLLMFVYSEQILGGGVLTKLLSNKIFLYLGSVSFSFFITHQLVIRAVSMLSSYFGIEVHNVTGLIVTFLLALLASMFCYHYIEKPASKKLNKTLFI